MKQKVTWLGPLAAALSALCLTPTIHAQTTATLSGCASQSPPFVIMRAGVGSTGFSVDHFQGVAKSIGKTGLILDLPWARCLREVAEGKIDVAVDAYDDVERHTKYLYSAPYYTLTPQVFFRRTKAGSDTLAKSAAELSKLTGCGVHEYTYEHYGLDAKRMDRGAKTNKHMIQMLLAGRCDYAVEELEYIIGGRQNEGDWPDESDLRSYRPKWAKAPELHYLVGRNHPTGKQLQAAINHAVENMEISGEAKALRTAYFSTVPAKRNQ